MRRESVPDIGIAIVIGAGLGTVVFVLTHNAVWIALGAAFGVVVGSVISALRR